MPELTPSQQRAVAVTGDVLVMAGAGTGKTRTLVERVLERVLHRAPRLSLEQMLVITFTEAAAAELRLRLRQALEERADADAGDRWLEEQIALLDTAQISTIHAFCLRLLRENFHELGLDPQFTVQDEASSKVLRAETLDGVLRGYLSGESARSATVRPLLERHGRPSLQPLRALVLRIYKYAQALPDAENWLMEQRDCYSTSSPAAWRASLGPDASAWAAEWRDYLDTLADISLPARQCRDALAPLDHREERSPTSRAEGGGARRMDDRCSEPSAPDIINALEVVLAIDQPATWPPRRKTALRKPLKKLFEEAAALRDLLVPALGGAGARSSAPPRSGAPREAADNAFGQRDALRSALDPILEDWRYVQNDVLGLLSLVEDFRTAFSEAKRAAAAVDFSDLEQFALQLLWNSERRELTPLAREWQERLGLVCVDEYQDVNAAQDRIISCLSRGVERGADRFLVGDVKQSIYRFRLANPHIFQEYARTWRSRSGAQVIPLQENFRSHPAILEFVNELFARTMRAEVGGVTYDDEARLLCGETARSASVEQPPGARVELHLQVTGPVQGAGDPEGEHDDAGAARTAAPVAEDLDAAEAEAWMVARRLRELCDRHFAVWDPRAQRHRPMQWSDVAVLHRSPRPVAERWAMTFNRAGVPLAADRSGFFDASEVSDLLSLVAILDNPLQDLPLLAVLRSPLVGLTVSELAVIRAASPGTLFWPAVEGFRIKNRPGAADATPVPGNEPGNPGASRDLPGSATADGAWARIAAAAREKLARFLPAYRRWRKLGRETSLAACLETVLTETHYEAWLRTQDRAAARIANVRKLLALTRQFDQSQRHSVFRFVQFVEAQREAETDVEVARAVESDSVRLLSIHASKGLEFPVVVVAGLGRPIELREVHSAWLLDENHGICPPVLPPGAAVRYHSLPWWFAGQRQRREVIGEELRLLYVACTRARDKLLLTGAVAARGLERWRATGRGLTSREIAQASRPLDWLGPLLAELTGDPSWARTGTGNGRHLDWHIHPPVFPGTSPIIPPVSQRSAWTPDALEELRQRLGWSYPFLAPTTEPAKVSVTELGRRWQDAADDEVAIVRPLAIERERLVSREGSSAVERGLAHHQFCELVELLATGSLDGLRAQGDALVRHGRMTAEQVALLDWKGLHGFWASELGARIRAEWRNVRRELRFTARLSAADVAAVSGIAPPGPRGDADFALLQGIADLVVTRPGELWLVDFKTDQVSDAALSARAREYAAQMRLYALALGRILRRPVTESWLYFVAPRRLTAVE